MQISYFLKYISIFQVLKEVETMSSSMEEIVSKVLTKVSKKLEAHKKTFYQFMDAAVTSITSSAVASGRATAKQVTKELHSVTNKLKKKIDQVSL